MEFIWSILLISILHFATIHAKFDNVRKLSLLLQPKTLKITFNNKTPYFGINVKNNNELYGIEYNLLRVIGEQFNLKLTFNSKEYKSGIDFFEEKYFVMNSILLKKNRKLFYF